MKSSASSFAIPLVMLPVLFLACAFPAETTAAPIPKIVTSSPCSHPPRIDGRIDDDEWKDAKVIEFELAMLKVKAGTLANRDCQLRVMNSANALYIALKVPDPALNKSLAPVDIDFANLAFCRGTEVASGDDRKGVAVGFYLDKHVTTPGQDADDAQKDGTGAMTYDESEKTYTIEWAMPLDSGDKNDFQAKPGDKLKFNLAYIDSFQADLKETHMGSLYPGGLDQPKEWGMIELATDVKDDGGIAFLGSEWIRKLFGKFDSKVANRLRFVETTVLPSLEGPVAKVLVEYDYRDPQGKMVTGKAKIYLPDNAQPKAAERALYYSAGYELDDASAVAHVGRGFVVVTPRALEVNPLVRTTNPDFALLHIARSLPFIDDARIIIAGGSAGGYITLMLAAETFPVTGAAPDVPPINWGYNAAYFLQRERGDSRKGANAVPTPVFDVIVPTVQLATAVYGEDTSSEIYYQHSPLSQLETITCPVSVYWTTADVLVPIDQVGKAWVRPFDAMKFPPDFTFDPELLTSSASGRRRLTDVLHESDYELFVVTEDTVKQHVGGPPADLAVSDQKRWSITVLDEGQPEPQLGHAKYPVPWSNKNFLAKVLAGKLAVSQLTAKKLERLMDRYAAREWLPSKLVHLDEPESEKADVVRGLKTYVATGPEHARRFQELYKDLPSNKQVLPEPLVEELQR